MLKAQRFALLVFGWTFEELEKLNENIFQKFDFFYNYVQLWFYPEKPSIRIQILTDKHLENNPSYSFILFSFNLDLK